MKKLLVILLILSSVLNAQDKEEKTTEEKVNMLMPGESRFLLRGYAHSGFESYDDRSSFVGGSFNPIFLWQQSKKLLFESELELELEDGETHLSLEYANMAYLLNSYATLRLGLFLLPYGTFAERLHPRWINRLPSNPLGFGHDPVGPMSDLGAEIRGGAYLGSTKFNYSLYVTNGPRLNDGTNPELEAEEAGMLVYRNYDDNNKNKAVGGRFGYLPISNSSLEFGVSAQYAKVGDYQSDYEDVGALMYALDISYVKKISALKSFIDIKGQFNGVNVDEANYYSEEDSSFYTFKNESRAYYLQFGIRPAFVKNSFFKNVEFVARYSGLDFPEGALWESKQTQYALGINYWIDWRSVIKIAYQRTEAESPGGEEGHSGGDENAFFVHWAFGF